MDRSGAYIARYLAKNVVASGLAERCTIQVAYGIGLEKPLSLYLETHGTGRVSEAGLADFISNHVDLTPKGLIERLELRRPIYQKTASYGHFGRAYEESTGRFPCERTDFAATLREKFSKVF